MHPSTWSLQGFLQSTSGDRCCVKRPINPERQCQRSEFQAVQVLGYVPQRNCPKSATRLSTDDHVTSLALAYEGMAHEAQKSFNESTVELQQKVRLSRRGYDGQGCLETWTCYLCFVMDFGFVLRGLNPTKFPKQFDTHCRVLTLDRCRGSTLSYS